MLVNDFYFVKTDASAETFRVASKEGKLVSDGEVFDEYTHDSHFYY